MTLAERNAVDESEPKKAVARMHLLATNCVSWDFRTWMLFYLQFGGFVLGIACLAVVMLLTYGNLKLR